MNKINCPECNHTFEIDDNSYAKILQQVQTDEFNKQVDEGVKKEKSLNAERLKVIEEKHKSELVELERKKDAQHKLELEKKDEEKQTLQDHIKRLNEMKSQLSTKMIGESLEIHCKNEFEKVRHIGFQNAYFEKDNDASSGSKGDFIFRDYEDGIEYISIMFEMKNESDGTNNKTKNEHFYKELDKDRNQKGCEYAILVSLLEKESDYFNQGIVDVSEKYDKMFVVRPQFFIPMISLLRNAAKKSLDVKKELILAKEQNIDISNFEEDFSNFKDNFGNNVRLAHGQYKTAIKQIDDAIKDLEKVKENLTKADKNLGIADKKVNDMTIKKLTKNNTTMQKKFGI